MKNKLIFIYLTIFFTKISFSEENIFLHINFLTEKDDYIGQNEYRIAIDSLPKLEHPNKVHFALSRKFFLSRNLYLQISNFAGTEYQVVYLGYDKSIGNTTETTQKQKAPKTVNYGIIALKEMPNGKKNEKEIDPILNQKADISDPSLAKLNDLTVYAYLLTRSDHRGWTLRNGVEKKTEIIFDKRGNFYVGDNIGANIHLENLPKIEDNINKIKNHNNIVFGVDCAKFTLKSENINFNIVFGVQNIANGFDGAGNIVLGFKNAKYEMITPFYFEEDYVFGLSGSRRLNNNNVILGYGCMRANLENLFKSAQTPSNQNIIIGNLNASDMTRASRNIIIGNKNFLHGWKTVGTSGAVFEYVNNNIAIGNNIMWEAGDRRHKNILNNIFIITDGWIKQSSVGTGAMATDSVGDNSSYSIFIGTCGNAERKDRTNETYIANVYGKDLTLSEISTTNGTQLKNIFGQVSPPHTVFVSYEGLLGYPYMKSYQPINIGEIPPGNLTKTDMDNAYQELLNLPITGIRLDRDATANDIYGNLFFVDTNALIEDIAIAESCKNLLLYTIFSEPPVQGVVNSGGTFSLTDEQKAQIENTIVGYEPYYLIPLLIYSIQKIVFSNSKLYKGLEKVINGLERRMEKVRNIDEADFEIIEGLKIIKDLIKKN